MALGDLTSRQAVLDAVAEFDRLGRDAFLGKYGFGKARDYFLVVDGRRYDSKAIVGAAHGFQFPNQGPLTAADFSGGENTVARRLGELDFDVTGPTEPGTEGDQTARNPTWSRDELILAFDFYMRHRPSFPTQTSTEIGELSALLNRLASARGGRFGGTYRNANGVYMKLMNFRRFDPDEIAAGRRGLKAGGRGEQEVWERFFADLHGLRLVAATIREAVAYDQVPEAADPELEETITEAAEGAVLTRLHQTRERNRAIVKACKQRAMKRFGQLRCEACGFSYAERYGAVGENYIECHHKKPVHTLQPNDKTRIEDLALVCANCHRMIHARRPWLTMGQLEQLLREPRRAD